MKCVTYAPLCTIHGKRKYTCRRRKRGGWQCPKCRAIYWPVTDWEYEHDMEEYAVTLARTKKDVVVNPTD